MSFSKSFNPQLLPLISVWAELLHGRKTRRYPQAEKLGKRGEKVKKSEELPSEMW